MAVFEGVQGNAGGFSNILALPPIDGRITCRNQLFSNGGEGRGVTEGQSKQAEMVAAAIRHPIRVRALEWMNIPRGEGRELSAKLFINQGLGKGMAELKPLVHRDQVSKVSYHLRELEKAGAVYETRSVPRRGGVEIFYRAHAVAYFSDVVWAATELEQRQGISRVVAQGLVVQIEGAIYTGVFDARTNRWLLWEPMELDEQAWGELATAFASFHAEAKHIERGAEKRLEEQGDEARPIPTTFALLMFESAPLPVDHLEEDVSKTGEDAPAD
jgi:DNA-binding transcriptional ArsR family regulator